MENQSEISDKKQEIENLNKPVGKEETRKLSDSQGKKAIEEGGN